MTKQESLANALKKPVDLPTDEVAVPEWVKNFGHPDFEKVTKERYKQIRSEKLPREDLEFLYAGQEAFTELIQARREESDHQLKELFALIDIVTDEIKDRLVRANILQIVHTLTALNIGYEDGKKSIARMGAAKTNLIKSAKIKKRQEWYACNYTTMLSIDPKKRSQRKIATVAEMQQTLADKFGVSLDTAKNDIASVRKELKKRG